MDEVNSLLGSFGLEKSEIDIYLLLLKKGILSATEISKFTKIPKTSVYRFLEQLSSKKLVNEIIEESRRLFEASSAENLKYKIIEEEEKVKSLSENFPKILDILSLETKEDVARSKIKYYSGIDGLKQITWNSSKAKDMLRIFEIESMSTFLNFDFCEVTRREFVKNKVFTRELSNEAKIPGWTNVKEMVKSFWEIRYVDPKELKMEFEMIVYNDVFVMYNYQDGEIFCAEIYNERLARMQKQVFDFIYLKGKKYKVLDDQGRCEVLK